RARGGRDRRRRGRSRGGRSGRGRRGDRRGRALRLLAQAGRDQGEAEWGLRVVVVALADVLAGVGADQVAGHVRDQPLLRAAGRVLLARNRAVDLEAGVLQDQRVIRLDLQVDRDGRLVALLGEL